MICNGCGGEFQDDHLVGTLSYGSAHLENATATARSRAVYSEYHKTLCPRCLHVMKDILLSSDLSEQWHKYNWSLQPDTYTEPYDG